MVATLTWIGSTPKSNYLEKHDNLPKHKPHILNMAYRIYIGVE
jgi:hypothetical protein